MHDGETKHGAGCQFDRLVDYLYINDMETAIECIFDSNVSKAGTNYRGYKILFPTVQKLQNADMVFVTTIKYEDEIKEVLKNRGVDRGEIHMISDFAE